MQFLVLALVVVVSFSAARFSTAFTRFVLVLGAVMVVIGIVNVGRTAMTADRGEEARLQAMELRLRLDAASPKEGLDDEVDEKKVVEALVELEKLLEAADVRPTVTALTPVVDELQRLTPQAIAARLDEIQTVVDALDDEDLRSRATAAIALIQEPPAVSPPAEEPTSAAAEQAIDVLCEAGGGVVQESSNVCGEGEDGGVSLANLDDQAAKADLEVARYELALAESDEAVKTLAAAVETKSDAYATALRRRPDPDVDAVDALREGAGEVMGSFGGSRSILGIDLGVFGWLAFGGIALLWYRVVERRTAARGLGPATVQGDPTYLEQFRTYLHRNVPDPGAVPGATALLPVTDLLAVTKTPAGDALSKLIAAIVAVLDQKRGYSVTFKSLSPDAADATGEKEGPPRDDERTQTVSPDAADATGKKEGPPRDDERTQTVVAVRVSHARTGALVDQQLVRDHKPSEAIRKAAYWAATVVIDRSDRVPHWAQWPSGTANSLATYRALEDKGEEEALEEIVGAVTRAPRSGVLCLQLSHAYALNGRHLEAFEFALRAAAVDGHYLAARYRLAMTASLMASDVDTNWRTRPIPQRARVVEALGRYSFSPTAELTEELGRGDDDRLRKALCYFALAELDAIGGLLVLPRLLNNSLRRSERGYWLALLRRGERGVSGRVQFLRAIDSARPAVMIRGVSSDTRGMAADIAGNKEQTEAAKVRARRKEKNARQADKGAKQEARAAKESPEDEAKVHAAADARRRARTARDEADAAVAAHVLATAGVDLEKLLANRATFWQVAYNVACYDAIRYNYDGVGKRAAEAIEHLESALERPGSHQLTRSWVETDPDLKSLHSLARFQAFTTLLYDDRRSYADS